MADGEREETGKRYPLNMRTTREVREKLEATANASGRSLSQEVEFRLEASLHREVLDQVSAGGGITADMFSTMAKVIYEVKGSALRRNWSEKNASYAIRAAVVNIADVYFWNGRDDLLSQPAGETHGENAVPAAVGHEIATGHLIWSEDPLQEEATSYTIVNRWSGDGTVTKSVRENFRDLPADGTPPGKKSLKEITGR